ncbi:MAG: AAA family ATPase [Methylophaga sp.]|nr:AAA family ATPase [Methylophaga sp.]
MSNSLRIKSVSVKGLFNQFDHHIDFNQEERITILHGINGVGKTTLLRMINNLFNFRIYNLNEIPFTSFVVELSNDEKIKIKRLDHSSAGSVIHIFVNGVRIEYKNVDINYILRRCPWVSRSENVMFYDNKMEKSLSLRELLEQYDDRFPKNKHVEDLEVFKNLRSIPMQFTETARLVQTDNNRRKGVSISTVKVYALELQQCIKNTMASYAKKTQELEQSFPFRLLEIPERYSDEVLKQHIEALQDRRQEFRDIGLLPETDLAPMDAGSIDTLESHHAEVMNLYVKDSKEKLDVLQPLSEKIELLLKIINGNFQGKELHIDENKGLIIIAKDGKEIDLSLLSSGEQHELVMFYVLIFKVAPNTLVMIDEPELSLHISWQHKFIDELKEIIKQAKFDVLMATHSPTIVGNNVHLMIGLGDTQ